MFVFKNAWKSVVRNKGRNILIAIIVAIIAAAATIGLSIRQAADSARATGLEDTSVTAQISVNREKLISSAQSSSSSSSSSSKPDFSAARSALASKTLSLASYEKYAKASTVKTGTYYTETSSVSKTDSFQPVSTTSTSSSSSSSSSGQAAGQGAGGGMGGGMGAEETQSGDFSLVGFSSDTAVKNATNGTFTMTSGKVFGYTSSSNSDVIISKSLADFNKVSVGDTISVTNPYDTSKTIKLKVVGIYKNTTDTSSSNNGPSQSTSSDPSNAIYTSISTLKALGLDASSTVTTTDSSGTSTKTAAAQLSYTYVLGSKSAYTTFTKDVKKAGLSSDYTVSSADVEEYKSSLLPLNNLAKFALTLLLVVLAVGGVVLIVLSLFNVRERKYEVGVLTAMGVKKAKVATQFAIELLIVTMIGLGVGAVAGAATSVPVSNQLLASQVSQQESQASTQEAQFGRGANVGGSGTSTSGTSGSSSGTTTGKTAAAPTQGTGNPFSTKAVSYVSSINTSVSLSMVGQLLLIGLGLTLISALVGVIFVMRYEPLQILADRS
ncbi:FtsX-like permease family protein [Bifidobacterium fermentum]|uniref:ABC transporter permease n=1 Tax=Bifidobacterium fermentum TaxID=3059035 RepID=A0AB39UGU9_9BIFI